MIAGFVLAGGASRRMGRSKALLPFRGATLIEHVVRQVSAVASPVRVVGSTKAVAGLGLASVSDLFPHEGPLGGIVTALTQSQADWNLIVACDMPSITPERLGELLDATADHDCDAVVPITGDGRRHPLCAVYRRTALPGLRSAWKDGTRSASDALKYIRTEYLPCGNATGVTNINTPAEWRAFRGTTG